MTTDESDLAQQQKVWEAWAQEDPMWAILSDPNLTGGRWKPDEFYASGYPDIEALFAALAGLGLKVSPGRCMDFGCGMGRLSQALADRFAQVDGVDISPTMVELATKYNVKGEVCNFHVNGAADLGLFPDSTFDMVYTAIVLQHNSPPMAEAYMREFVRVLRPGGIAVFDMPAKLLKEPEACVLPTGAHLAAIRIADELPRFVPGESAVLRVDVTNASDVDWPAAAKVRLGNHWLTRSGRTLVNDDGRVSVGALPAGNSNEFDLIVQVPTEPQELTLALDLVEEGIDWFERRGSSTLRAAVDAQRSHSKRWFGRSRSTSAPTGAPESFTMNALPRERVIEVVTDAGGELIAAQPSSGAGPEWESYRYFVRRPA